MRFKFHPTYRNIRRLRDIVSILVRHGFSPLMERLHLLKLVSIPARIMGKKITREKEAVTAPVRLRSALEELGPTFIKFGQILSTRPDIIPEDYLAELLKLQDTVAPLPFPEVIKVIESEFKKPVSMVFKSVEEASIAAASIAQVHRAAALSGEEVAIKVQRPGIGDTIAQDVVILEYLARILLKYLPESRLYDPAGMVEEFSRVIKREMDFTLEASYMERFRENFANDPRVFIPKVFWDLTTRRVLTMDRVQGIKIDRVDLLREKGIDTEKVARLIVNIFFKQVFEFGLFHGDLHSGNIFVMDEERIAFVDYGIVGRIGPELKQRLADILISFVSGDIEMLTRTYQLMGILPRDIDKASFEREYYDIMLHYFGRPLKYARIGELLTDYIRLAARHNIVQPRDLLLFDKCVIEIEGLSRLLYPGINILIECEPYASKLYRERLSPSNFAKEALSTFTGYREFAHRLPAEAEEILKKIINDKIRIEFVHRGLEDFMGEIDRSSHRLTLGVIVAALLIASSWVVASRITPTFAGYPIFGLFGFGVAAFLGLWLGIQILRSGKF